ncbi:hypothetical protein D3C72_865020 [compost metagenome]
MVGNWGALVVWWARTVGVSRIPMRQGTFTGGYRRLEAWWEQITKKGLSNIPTRPAILLSAPVQEGWRALITAKSATATLVEMRLVGTTRGGWSEPTM